MRRAEAQNWIHKQVWAEDAAAAGGIEDTVIKRLGRKRIMRIATLCRPLRKGDGSWKAITSICDAHCFKFRLSSRLGFWRRKVLVISFGFAPLLTRQCL